jgi:hypothetical protein
MVDYGTVKKRVGEEGARREREGEVNIQSIRKRNRKEDVT